MKSRSERHFVERLRMEILSRMNDSGKTPLLSLSSLLWVLSLFYGSVLKVRKTLDERGMIRAKKLTCAVISIGNITLGGTGKTPMVVYMAKFITRLGFRAAVLSRGYRGLSEKTGGVVSDGLSIRMTPEESGDEPYMLAGRLTGIPVLVGRDRYAMGKRAIREFATEVLILDDGFQHTALFRDLDLVLLDSRALFGNGHLFPRGILREPVSALRRADALIITKIDPAERHEADFGELKKRGGFEGKPIFRSLHTPFFYRLTGRKPAKCDPSHVYGKKIVAFSGIAQNADFRDTLERYGCKIASFHPFADHHPYTDAELEHIWQDAKEAFAEFVVTTEKDYSRIQGRIQNKPELLIVGIRVSIMDEERLFTFISRHLMNRFPASRNRVSGYPIRSSVESADPKGDVLGHHQP
ncbi:MAG: tetraacyldisaccharide 4'-kinase [Pseudomonadota bacterium]